MTMRKRNPIAQEENGFYRTPYWVSDALCHAESFGPEIWEPACGEGDISEVLKFYGYHVYSSDLINRGYAMPGSSPVVLDFLKVAPFWDKDAIITNPPYKLAEEFLHAAVTHKPKKIAFLLRLSFLEGSRRYVSLFRDTPPSRVLVLSARPTLWHGSDPEIRTSGGAISYAWFVWDREDYGKRLPPRLHWLGKPSNLQLAIQANRNARRRLSALLANASN